MEPRTGRIARLHLAALLLLTLAAAQGRAQYASPYGNGNGNTYTISRPNSYAQPYSPDGVQSVWTGAPIVVNDNAFGAQEQQQPYPDISEYYPGESFRRPNLGWRREELDERWPTTTRAPNHNYHNVPGYFYYQQQEAAGRRTYPYLPANSELDSSDSRREEEQVVQIGGSRTLAANNYQNVYANSGGNYYEPAQPWRRRDYEAKYAEHFANYLRKYPQRLQPVYNAGEDFDEK